MDLALVIVTVISLGMATAMFAVTWRMMREERRRSAVRVEALAAAARTIAAADSPAGPRSAPWQASGATSEPSAYPSLSTFAAEPTPRLVAPANESARQVEPVSTEMQGGVSGDREDRFSSSPDLFATPVRASHAPGRFGIVATIGALVVGLVVTTTLLSSRGRTHSAATGSAAAQSVTAAQAAAPLELVSLTHRREGSRLSISGVVRNPTGGVRVTHLTAMVFLFDGTGSFLSSGRAPIDFSALAPGDESPFVVALTEPGSVGRYRVSFRTDDRVVPHVDRRSDNAMAAARR